MPEFLIRIIGKIGIFLINAFASLVFVVLIFGLYQACIEGVFSLHNNTSFMLFSIFFNGGIITVIIVFQNKIINVIQKTSSWYNTKNNYMISFISIIAGWNLLKLLWNNSVSYEYYDESLSNGKFLLYSSMITTLFLIWILALKPYYEIYKEAKNGFNGSTEKVTQLGNIAMPNADEEERYDDEQFKEEGKIINKYKDN